MGILSDTPAPRSARGGAGQKFVELYRSLDADDQARVRAWCEDPLFPTTEIHRRLLAAGIDVGYSTVERGLALLEECQWEC